MQCVHQSRNGMCVASCTSLVSCTRFVSWACSHSPVYCSCLSFSINSFSSLICHRILTFFQTVQFLLCTTFLTLTALRPWSYRFVCDTGATHYPCQQKTGPVSSRHTHMTMMMHTQLFTSSLMTVQVSIVSNVRILFIQHNAIARRTRASQRSHS